MRAKKKKKIRISHYKIKKYVGVAYQKVDKQEGEDSIKEEVNIHNPPFHVGALFSMTSLHQFYYRFYFCIFMFNILSYIVNQVQPQTHNYNSKQH